MARINIEDNIFKDFRFSNLVIKLGDLDTALGALVRAWSLAQKWYLSPEKMIPISEWKTQQIRDEIIEVGLAKLVDQKVYLCGAEIQFSWLDQRSKAGKLGGPAASMTRVENIKESVRRKSSEHVGSRPLTLPLSLTLDKTTKNKESIGANAKSLKNSSPRDSTNVSSPAGYFISVYVKAYQSRYGGNTRPDLRGKIQGQIKKLLSEMSVTRACELIQVYMQMDGERDWFKTKGHDFTTFVENLNPVGIALDTGKCSGARSTLEIMQEFESREAKRKMEAAE